MPYKKTLKRGGSILKVGEYAKNLNLYKPKSQNRLTLPKLTKNIITDVLNPYEDRATAFGHKLTKKDKQILLWEKRFSLANKNTKKKKLYNKLYKSFTKGRLNINKIAKIKNLNKQNKRSTMRRKLKYLYGSGSLYKNLGKLPDKYTKP